MPKRLLPTSSALVLSLVHVLGTNAVDDRDLLSRPCTNRMAHHIDWLGQVGDLVDSGLDAFAFDDIAGRRW